MRNEPVAEPDGAGLRPEHENDGTQSLVSVRVGDRQRQPLAVLRPSPLTRDPRQALRLAEARGNRGALGISGQLLAASTHAMSVSAQRRNRTTPSLSGGSG